MKALRRLWRRVPERRRVSRERMTDILVATCPTYFHFASAKDAHEYIKGISR